MAYNKQPIFTGTGILNVSHFEPPIIEDMELATGPLPTTICDGGVTEGTLIERVTVTSGTETINYPSNINKLVYLFIWDDGASAWVLYDSKFLPAITVDNTTPNSRIQWVFEGGLYLPSTYQLGIGVSAYSGQGDYLHVVVEGGTYTLVS